MKISEALKVLSTELRNDPEFRIAWVANIAMAFKDTHDNYTSMIKVEKLSRKGIDIVANAAADYFIGLISEDKKESPSGPDGMVAVGVGIYESLQKTIKERQK